MGAKHDRSHGFWYIVKRETVAILEDAGQNFDGEEANGHIDYNINEILSDKNAWKDTYRQPM